MFRFLRELLGQFIHPAFINQKQDLTKIISTSNTSTRDETDRLCSLDIQMNQDGTINIVCSWPDFHMEDKASIPTVAYQYALVIDAVNNGLLAKEIISTIKNYNSDNTADILFAQNVLYKLSEIAFLNAQNNNQLKTEPVIRPLDVLKQRN